MPRGRLVFYPYPRTGAGGKRGTSYSLRKIYVNTYRITDWNSAVLSDANSPRFDTLIRKPGFIRRNFIGRRYLVEGACVGRDIKLRSDPYKLICLFVLANEIQQTVCLGGVGGGFEGLSPTETVSVAEFSEYLCRIRKIAFPLKRARPLPVTRPEKRGPRSRTSHPQWSLPISPTSSSFSSRAGLQSSRFFRFPRELCGIVRIGGGTAIREETGLAA